MDHAGVSSEWFDGEAGLLFQIVKVFEDSLATFDVTGRNLLVGHSRQSGDQKKNVPARVHLGWSFEGLPHSIREPSSHRASPPATRAARHPRSISSDSSLPVNSALGPT